MAFDVLSQVGGPVKHLLAILNRLHDSIPRAHLGSYGEPEGGCV